MTEQNNPNVEDTSGDEAPINSGEVARAPERRRFWARAWKVLLLLLLIFIAIGVGGVLFIQLPIGKRFVLNELVNLVENNTRGTLSVGQIDGNLFEGFVLDDVTLRLKTGASYDTVPLFHADQILARYSILGFLRKGEIRITQLVLVRPVVRLVKFSGDTIWNYNLFLKPSAPGAASQPFRGIVDLASFRIQNGSVSVRDYTTPVRSHPNGANESNAIDWSNLNVQGIDLDSRCYARGEAMQEAEIHQMRLTETHSGFTLQQLACSLYRDSSSVRIDTGIIVTGHSDLHISVQASQPDILAHLQLDSMRHTQIAAKLNGVAISTSELKQFLPGPLGFLAGSPGIKLDAAGEFGNLHIKKLALDFMGEGNLAVAGDVKNLDRPDSLWMNLRFVGKRLSNTTLASYVPGLHLPNLARVGNVNIPHLTFTGYPLHFRTTFIAQSTGAGNASGDVTLGLRSHRLAYHVGVTTESLNLAALTNREQYQSSISAQLQIAGSGTNWKTMNATIATKASAPSSFGRYRFTSLDAAGVVTAGTLTANHLDAELQSGPEVHIRSAMLGLSKQSLPFQFNGTIANFPLAEVIGAKNPARVSLTADLTGHATDFEDVDGMVRARLFHLEYRGHTLPDDTLELNITKSGPEESTLLLRSSIADLIILHRFTLGNLTEDIPLRVRALLTAIGHREFPQPGQLAPPAIPCADSMNFDYRLRIKDLRALADFLPRTFLLGQGLIFGNVQGCPDGNVNMTINGDSLGVILRNRTLLDTAILLGDTALSMEPDSMTTIALEQDTTGRVAARLRQDTSAFSLPHFGAGLPRIHLMPTRFRLTLRNLTPDPAFALQQLGASLDVQSDSIVRLGSALLFHPSIKMHYDTEALRFKMGTVYNNAFGVHISGTANVPTGNMDVTLDTLLVDYNNPTPVPPELHHYIWKNEGPVHIVVDTAGTLRLDTMTVLHSLTDEKVPDNIDAMRLNIAGTLHGDTVNASASIPLFQLEKMKQILPPFNPNAKTFGFADFDGDIRNTNVTLSGTLERPEFTATLFADTIKYIEPDTIFFDSNAVHLQYIHQALHGSLTLHVSKFRTTAPGLNSDFFQGRSELNAIIDSIPMVIAFKRGPSYSLDSASAATRPLAAHLDASHFPLDVATPFLPPFQQVQGTGDIHFGISGTRKAIDYSGNANIENGAALLAATNMWYRIAGPLTFAHNALTLDNDTIRNVASDDSNGEASLNGSFHFDGFNITNFDLGLRSNEIMVLSNAAKLSTLPAYGPVIVNTGGADFRFYNTFDAPWISGTINIMSAQVTMPQTDEVPQTISDAGILYETLPNDSIQEARRLARRFARHTTPAEQANASGVPSIQRSFPDDTLFPNRMKNIFWNDDGTFRTNPYVDSLTAATTNDVLAPSFADKLRMNLRLMTEGSARILIPFGGSLGLLGAELNAVLAPGGALSIQRGDDLQSIAIGGFDLAQSSSFTFVKPFSITSGKISYMKDFGNPSIDITAEYTGPHSSQSVTDDVKIVLTVSGTKNRPILTAMNYEGSGGNFSIKPEQSPNQAEEDALSYLATGQFRSDLASGQSGSATANILQNLGTGLAGKMFNDLLRTTSIPVALQSLALNLGSTGTTSQVSAAVLHGITLKTGFYFPSSTTTNQFGLNVTTDIPFSSFISSPWANNLMMETQYNSSPSTGSSILAQQPIWLSKLVITAFRW